MNHRTGASLRRIILPACLVALALTLAGAAGADSSHRSSAVVPALNLVEIKVADRAAIDVLMEETEALGAEFNDHYLRHEDDGTLTVQVLGDDAQIAELRDRGYEILRTIEDEETYWERVAERVRAIDAEQRAEETAEEGTPPSFNAFGLRASVAALAVSSEITVNRVDYFENYAGRFLSVEAFNSSTVARTGGGQTAGQGPTMVVTWDGGPGTEIGAGGPRTMSAYVDTDPAQATYLYHRMLIRIGAPGTSNPPKPARIRVASSTGAVEEADVNTWLGTALPPHAEGFLSNFHNRYMDPTEVYERFEQLAAEFGGPGGIVDLIDLPHKTNGYQRKAMANMIGTTAIGNTPPTTAAQGQTVVLVSRAWGHEGGNDVSAAFVNPGVADSPLQVLRSGNDITVSLGTNEAGALASTAAQVVAAINADPAASGLVKALTYRGNAGAGVVPARAKVNLSDFLSVSTSIPASGIPHGNEHVQRGPFQPKVMRIGKSRDGSKVGIYLFCQQHAREWVTPITCLETAERLLRNYAIDPLTRDFVDNLDIFILPSVNPDGAHHSFYNFQSQRRTMTNHCVHGGHDGDDPTAANFWMPKVQGNGATPINTDAASRNSWGVDLNRNQSEGTIFDGYVGASHSCTSDTFAGPSEVSEPEALNEKWIVDVLGPNIKFSNNIHTSGGYFMWAPGAYKSTRETLPAPNIGIEKYFFAAAETVLGRIKEYRGNVVLPQRTGPIADVLYSAAGNSADDNYYRKGIIGYSFEAGADIFTTVTLTQPAAAGATGVRVSSTTGMAANDYITVGWNGSTPEVRRIASIPSPAPANPNPNVILQEPLANDHAIGAQVNGGTAQSGVGFFPNYGNEGRHEANEFANGNYGLLEAALAYSRDKEAPEVRMTGIRASKNPIRTTFEYVNEPSVIHYTVDGSTPTFDSPKWDRQGLRRPGEVFEFAESTTVKWLALDLAGNTSTGEARFSIDNTAPTIDLRVPANGGQYLLGSAHEVDFDCADDDAGVVACEGTQADGAALDTGSIGRKSVTVTAEDAAGNTHSVTHTYNVHWPFGGFRAPLGAGVTIVKAGSTVPVKFSLGGNRGLDIFKTAPFSRQVNCATGANAGTATPPLGAALTFSSGLYQLDWKTDKAWAGTCRKVVLKLKDNRTYTATVKFN